MGRCRSNSTKFQLCKISSRDILFIFKRNTFYCSQWCSPLLHFSTVLVASKDGSPICFRTITHYILTRWTIWSLLGLKGLERPVEIFKFCMCVWTFNTCAMHCFLYQGSANLFYKGPDSKYFQLCRLYSSVATQLHNCSTKEATENM